MDAVLSAVTPSVSYSNDDPVNLRQDPWELVSWAVDAGTEIPAQLWFVMGDELTDGGVAKRDLHVLFMQRINNRQVEVQVSEDEVGVNDSDRPVFLLSWGINYDEIRRWLSICDKEHSQCQLEEPAIFPGLLVIDCHELKIVPPTQGCKYVALSYVWGASYTSAQESKHAISGTDLTHAHLPRTIRDSVTVTLQLGLRYLWVDRYCIDQTDVTLKHDLIANMDSIFHNAYLTIIAATGVDAYSGIPGVSYIARRMEFNGTANYLRGESRTLTNGMPIFTNTIRLRPDSEVALSVWSTRGWTYQEALLSRRRLIFTDTYTTFQCSSDSYRENLGVIEDQPASASGVFRQISSGHGIFSSINEYAVRELSFPTDSLSAFLGILRLYEKLDNTPVTHMWGLPLVCPDLGANQAEDVAWRKRLWAKSLLWLSPPKGLQRVDSLPSWSWSGWRGWKYDGEVEGERSMDKWRRPVGPYNVAERPDIGEGREFDETRFPRGHLIDVDTEIKWSGKILSVMDYNDALRLAPGAHGELEPVLYFTAWTTEINPRDDNIAVEPESLREYPDGSLVALVIAWGEEWSPGFCLLLGRNGHDSFSRLGTITHSWKDTIRRRWRDPWGWEKEKITQCGLEQLQIADRVFSKRRIAVQ
ncbi:putative Heterokaryon incompatibility domain-containing protein [Seiridium cardinale]